MDEDHANGGRSFVYSVQFLIIVSIIVFSIDTIPNLSSETKTLLNRTELVLLALFTLEYVLRLYSAESRLKFVTSFFGIIDLLAILPFFLVSGFDLRAIRLIRLTRLFRILKLARYNVAIQRFDKALRLAKEEILLFLSMTVIVLYLSAVGIYFFEHPTQPEAFSSIFSSLWWAVATLTTVGYGDVYPVTLGGRIFTFFVLMCGLGVVAVPAGIIASALARAGDVEIDHLDDIDEIPADSVDGLAKKIERFRRERGLTREELEDALREVFEKTTDDDGQ